MIGLRRLVQVVVLSTLAVVVAGGCGGSDDGQPGDADGTGAATSTVSGDTAGTVSGSTAPASPDDPVVTLAPAPDGPPDTGPAQPTPVTPSPGASDARPAALDHVVSDPASSRLELWFWNGVAPCAVLDRVDVEESDTQVRVTVYVGAGDVPADVACPDLAQLYSTTVELSRPLGAREVIDGSTR